MGHASFYYEGDCNDEEVKKIIRQKFIGLLTDPALKLPILFCAKFGAECNANNVNVYCGETTSRRRRRSRATQKEVYVKLQYVGTSLAGKGTTYQTIKSGMQSTDKPKVSGNLQAFDWTPLKSSLGLTLKSLSVSDAEPYCSEQGAMIGRCDAVMTTGCNDESGSIEKCSK